MQTENTVTIGKRTLQIVTAGPIRHDVWLMQQVRAAGIERVEMGKDESAEDLVDAMLDRVMQSGKALHLLGSMLAPADMKLEDWREETAQQMADFIGGLTDKEDKRVVRGLLAQCLAGFFANGLVSVRTSRTSSDEPAPAAVDTQSQPLAPTGA
jgi:hypothetical protein